MRKVNKQLKRHTINRTLNLKGVEEYQLTALVSAEHLLRRTVRWFKWRGILVDHQTTIGARAPRDSGICPSFLRRRSSDYHSLKISKLTHLSLSLSLKNETSVYLFWIPTLHLLSPNPCTTQALLTLADNKIQAIGASGYVYRKLGALFSAFKHL